MRVLVLLLLSGCLLGTRTPPLELRYFAPTDDVAASGDVAAGPAIRLGRVTASGYLRYRIAHRESPIEVLFYETLRWTERPDEYVRRALVRDLDRHAVQRMLAGDAPILEVEVTAFEEVRRGPRSFGRVQLRYRIDNETSVIAEDVITIEREARSRAIDEVVVAIGDAMHAATGELARRAPLAVRAQTLRETER